MTQQVRTLLNHLETECSRDELMGRTGSVAIFLSFVGFVQRSPGHLIQALHKQPSHDVKSNNGQPMDRGTYHRARGLFGFGYRAINHRIRPLRRGKRR